MIRIVVTALGETLELTQVLSKESSSFPGLVHADGGRADAALGRTRCCAHRRRPNSFLGALSHDGECVVRIRVQFKIRKKKLAKKLVSATLDLLSHGGVLKRITPSI